MRERCTRRSLSAEKQPQMQTSAGHTTVSEKPCPTKNRQHPLYKYLEKRRKNGNTCHCEALRRLYLSLVSKNGQKYGFQAACPDVIQITPRLTPLKNALQKKYKNGNSCQCETAWQLYFYRVTKTARFPKKAKISRYLNRGG